MDSPSISVFAGRWRFLPASDSRSRSVRPTLKPLVTYNVVVPDKDLTLARSPEELVYRSCYAPVDLHEMLQSAETRSRIRRLPASHLFFGLKELEDQARFRLLPHVTQEQWTGVLDLDLWSRDTMSVSQFLYWQQHIVESEDAVARKLVRAADPELWQLAFKRYLKIYPKSEDEVEGEPEDGEWMDTPDGDYLLVLPADAEQARIFRALLLRLYQLDQNWVRIMLESCRARTSSEIEEVAYQGRTRRIEETGFQDYYDAIEIYTFLPPDEELPEKIQKRIRQVNLTPARLPDPSTRPLLLFHALANLTRQQEIQPLVEELFYVCNRLLSADRISAADPADVKKGIRKAITGMNLGLDWWSGGDLGRASEGVRRCYLQSFFQAGYSRLLELQKQGREMEDRRPAEGSFLEAALQGLLEPYPLLAEKSKSTIRKRFFRTRRDLEVAQQYLDQMSRD